MNKYFLVTIAVLNVSVASGQVTPTATTPEYTNQRGLATVNALSAYNAGWSGAGVKIGIVDTGLYTSHVEFTNAVAAALGWAREPGSELLDTQWVSTTGTSNFSSFLNDKQADGTTTAGHGSFVSSISAARLDGSSRSGNIMGVAYNANLVIGQMIFNQCEKDAQGSCRTNPDGSQIYKAYGLNDAQSAEAINYVVNQGVKVINNSWGVGPSWGTSMTSTANTFVTDQPKTTAALINAVDKGAVVVFAAGNESIGWPGAPATLPSVNASLLSKGGWIVVAATTNRGVDLSGAIEMAQYRNPLSGPAQTGDWYTNYCGAAKLYCISAPGGYQNPINDPAHSDVGMSGALAGTTASYDQGNGTSYAAPVVTGAVAVVAEKYPWMTNKNLSVTILTTGTTASNPSDIWGRGLLDLGKAINGPAIFEEDFEANVTTGYASTFSNVISGTFGIKKLGVGSLTLSGINTFAGSTYLNGGSLVVNAMSGLGTATNALQFDGGTLKFGTNFDLTRDVNVATGGGVLDINGYTKTQTFSITGTGSFGIKGGGTFTLDRTNSTNIGFVVGSSADPTRTVVNASNNTYLGDTTGSVTLNNGQLNLGAFNSATSFTRQLAVGSGNGWFNASNLLTYTPTIIDKAADGTAGILYFTDQVLSIPGSLALNAYWGGNYTVSSGTTLSGTGGVMGNLTVNGTLAPGNSPGTLTVSGNVVQSAGSTLDIQIDGSGTGTGAGNYDRLVLTGAGSTYTADRTSPGVTLQTQLRGISGSANNNYSPSLGQGFQIITAPGGILGNFASFVQPTSGLLPGTQFDTVFGSTALSLYTTPSSYSNIAAAGVATNSNRQQIGDILQPIRPTPGIRETNTVYKTLFDSLAPQTTSSLPVAMDQLAGVGYGQLIGMNFENSKFLADQMATTVALHRRKETQNLIVGETESGLGDTPEEFWGMAVGRLSDWRGENVGYNTYDVLGGVMAGIQKRLSPQSLAGFSLAYAGSSPSISQNMGSGPMQNVQLMGYGSHALDDGFYVQGLLGGGGGTISASRNLSMMATSYTAQIQTANLAGSILAGWSTETTDQVRYETGVGVNYLGMRHFGFNDSGNQSAYALTTQAGNTQSLVPNLNATASLPFKAGQIDWRAHGLVNVGYETAANKITLQSNFLGSPISVDSGSIGRTRLNLGLGISGHVGKETKVALDVSNQSAQNWNATAANVSVRVGF